jgi:2,5-dihydroxypyridine 5,6-dioxygenase
VRYNMALHVEHTQLGAVYDREFYRTVRMMIADVQGITDEDSLVILFDSRTPIEVIRVYSAIANDLGAEVSVIEIPRPPARQTSHLIPPKPVVEALKVATAAIVSWIVYTKPLADAIESGVHVMWIPPGPDAPDMLIRAVGQVDMKKMEREAAKIAELWTRADELRIVSDLGTDLKADISGVECHPPKFPPAEAEKGKRWMTMAPWGTVGAGCNSIEGTLAVNGILGARPIGLFNLPNTPIIMEIKDNRIAKVKGDSKMWPPWQSFLNSFNDPNVYGFPAHGPAIGVNPNCFIGGPAEWERVKGCITFGAGDNAVLRRYWGGKRPGPVISAKVHWDLQVLGATLYLDDKVVVENGEINV